MSNGPYNPPAFPLKGTTEFDPDSDGMTLRDYFAGQALAGMCADSDCDFESTSALTRACYRIADAMLETRDKKEAQ